VSTVDFEVTVNGTDVAISAAGFDTDTQMKAKGVPDGNDLDITFDSACVDGPDLDPQCTNLVKGDKVLHLHRDGDNTILFFDKMHTPDKTPSLVADLEK
jgi:hypothetical protein